MENKKRANFIKGTLVAGALLSVTALSATPNSSLFEYNALGSGAEVRSEILHSDFSPLKTLEANCGEKTKSTETKKVEGKKAEAKCGEGKCGEGKCGEGDKKAEGKSTKTTTTTTVKKAEATTKETKAKTEIKK